LKIPATVQTGKSMQEHSTGCTNRPCGLQLGHCCIMWSTAGSISSSIDHSSGRSECCGDIVIIMFVPAVPLWQSGENGATHSKAHS